MRSLAGRARVVGLGEREQLAVGVGSGGGGGGGGARRGAGAGGLLHERQGGGGQRLEDLVLRLEVAPEVDFALEALAAAALGARERLVARVLPRVSDQVAALTERLAAHTALVRLLACTNTRTYCTHAHLYCTVLVRYCSLHFTTILYSLFSSAEDCNNNSIVHAHNISSTLMLCVTHSLLFSNHVPVKVQNLYMYTVQQYILYCSLECK